MRGGGKKLPKRAGKPPKVTQFVSWWDSNLQFRGCGVQRVRDTLKSEPISVPRPPACHVSACRTSGPTARFQVGSSPPPSTHTDVGTPRTPHYSKDGNRALSHRPRAREAAGPRSPARRRRPRSHRPGPGSRGCNRAQGSSLRRGPRSAEERRKQEGASLLRHPLRGGSPQEKIRVAVTKSTIKPQAPLKPVKRTYFSEVFPER